jgi:hypothetical protein
MTEAAATGAEFGQITRPTTEKKTLGKAEIEKSPDVQQPANDIVIGRQSVQAVRGK